MSVPITILINSLRPGGAERQVLQDAALLHSAGFEVTVVFGTSGSLEQLLDQSVKCYHLDTTSELTAIRKLRDWIRIHPTHLILSHGFWANKVAAATSLFSGIPFFAFEHGLGLWRKWYHIALVRWVASRANKVVTCSEANRQLKMRREGVPGSKIIVIPNSFVSHPAPHLVSDQKTEILHTESSKPGKPFVIGYCGRFNKVKQLDFFMDLAEQLQSRNVEFKILMLGDGAEKKRIEESIDRRKLQNCFQLAGYVSNPEEYYPGMDCFLLPSKREDFSLSLIEASDAGVPCIAFDVGGNKEIIQDGKTGYIILPFDLSELTNRIHTLIKNPGLASEMGSEAHTFVNQNFSQAKRAEKLTKLISTVQ